MRGNMGASSQDKIKVPQGHETPRQQSEARRGRCLSTRNLNKVTSKPTGN